MNTCLSNSPHRNCRNYCEQFTHTLPSTTGFRSYIDVLEKDIPDNDCRSKDDVFSNNNDLGVNDEYARISNRLKNLIDQFSEANIINYSDANKRTLEDIAIKLKSHDPRLLHFEFYDPSTMFFTFIKGQYSIYLQYFMDYNPLSDDDEAIATIFLDNKKKPSLAGDLQSILSTLSGLLY